MKKRPTKFPNNIIPSLIWLALFLLLFLSGFLVYLLINNDIEGLFHKGVIAVVILFLLYLGHYMFLGVTKYKKLILLNDQEHKANWERLSPEYKRYYLKSFKIGLFFNAFLIIWGAISIFMGNSQGWTSIIIGIGLGLDIIFRKYRPKK